MPGVLLPQSPSHNRSSQKHNVQTRHSHLTLKTLYNRAAGAFLQRDMHLTQSLLDSAWPLLFRLPSDVDSDILRRKWDILRITLAVTVYKNSPGGEKHIALGWDATVPPASLSTDLYTSSLSLFAPGSGQLPTAVVTAQVYAALKLGVEDVGRRIIEEWLSKRRGDGDEEDYEKVIELYALQVLTRLDEWEYARTFVQTDEYLDEDSKARLLDILASPPAVSLPQPPSPSSSTTFPLGPVDLPERATSPTPSSSSSSSLSTTTSQQTIKPTPRPNPLPTPSSLSATYLDANSTTISRSRAVPLSTSSPSSTPPLSSTRLPPSTAHNHTHLPFLSRPMPSSTSSPIVARLGTILYIIRNYVDPYLTKSNILAVFVFLTLSYLVSWRQRAVGGGNKKQMTALGSREIVKNRLAARSAGLLTGLLDFVRMAQGGLV